MPADTTDQKQRLPGPSKRSRVILVRPERIAQGFHALHNTNFRLFWISQLISLSGSWMQTTAQAWLVLKLTDSPLSLGLVTTLQFLPVTLLALYGGVLADRLRKRHALLMTQTAAMIQAFIFGFLVTAGHIQLWHIYVLASIQGLINAVDTPTRQAFVVELVGREELANAVALNSMGFNLARILGPSIAGVVIDQIGIAPTLIVNALSFIPVLLALLRMDASLLHTAPPSKTGAVRKQLLEGLSYTWHTPAVLSILIVVGFIGTFGYNFSIVLPLLARFVLNTDAAGFGSLTAFLGLGSFVGAVGAAYVSKVGMRRLLLGAGSFSILFGAVAMTRVFAVSAALLVALGLAGIIFATASNTLLQLEAPDELRGRVMSVYVLLFMGSTPIGGFLIGVLSDAFGVQVALLVCSVMCFGGVLIATAYYRSSQRRALPA